MNEERGARLEADLRAITAAATALMGARRVLISAGAGMSADSGVPTYRDEQGLWRSLEPFASKGVRPNEVAHLGGFRRDPHAAWGVHEWLRRKIAESEPHDGYRVVSRWLREVFPSAFVLTTNIDGLFARAGVPPHLLWERYGSIWELQCVAGCRAEWWPEPRAPLYELDEATLRAVEVPRCPFCGGPARPRAQLDDDDLFIQKAYGAELYERYIATDVEVYLVIGTTLWFSWPDWVKARPLVISVNPSAEAHAHYDSPIAITMGARDALAGIDWVMRRLAG